MTNVKCAIKTMAMMLLSIVPNLKIESITLHPTKQGYRNNKNKNKMKNMNTTHISPNEYSIDFTLKDVIIEKLRPIINVKHGVYLQDVKLEVVERGHDANRLLRGDPLDEIPEIKVTMFIKTQEDSRLIPGLY